MTSRRFGRTIAFASPFQIPLKGFGDLTEGKADDLPEPAFHCVGTLDEARERAKELAA